MLFGKNKKQQELEQRQELERIKLEKEENQRRLQLEREEAERKAAEEARLAARKASPYKFSVPNPMPKELVSVLCEMFKKLFPDATKAYLVLTQYEEKSGYLLVVDIDPKFHKIINIYLDGETKKVRNGLPIECILYSKSGDLTYGMKPFYEKAVPDIPKPVPELKISDAVMNSDDVEIPDFNNMITEDGFSAKDEADTEAVAEPEENETVETAETVETVESLKTTETDNEEATGESVTNTEAETDEPVAVEPEADASSDEPENPTVDATEQSPIPEMEIKKAPVKVVPETKQQLFLLMNRAASEDDEDIEQKLQMAKDGFAEYKFYIPFECDDDAMMGAVMTEFPKDSRLCLLLNRENGIKAAAFFTDEEPAIAFAKEMHCSIASVKYKDYKVAAEAGTVVAPAAEGIIINPDGEQILLPPDYPLL